MKNYIIKAAAKSFQGGSGSPLEARQTAPIFLIIMLLVIFILILAVVFFIYKAISSYFKSEKYIEKQKNRKTKRDDVEKLCKHNHFTKEDEKILWEICKITECNNIRYLIKSNAEITDLFRQAFNLAKETDSFDENQINDFFVILYKLELLAAQGKQISSTRQMTVGLNITFINMNGELYPLKIEKITKDFFIVAIPPFIYNSPQKPEPLSKQRFTYKTKEGLAYNLVSRVVRYEETPDNNYLMYLTHTDHLISQAQRHFKRDFIDVQCDFYPLTVNKSAQKEEEKYIFSEKKYSGKMTNISGGGCCIQTTLPIKEGQNISVTVPDYGIDEKIVGIIKKTRKLQNGNFALHIQFLKISTKTRNKIYLAIYKF